MRSFFACKAAGFEPPIEITQTVKPQQAEEAEGHAVQFGQHCGGVAPQTTGVGFEGRAGLAAIQQVAGVHAVGTGFNGGAVSGKGRGQGGLGLHPVHNPVGLLTKAGCLGQIFGGHMKRAEACSCGR